jgi:hypothetical protein
MKTKRGKVQKANSLNKAEEFRRKLLAANFDVFPGDIGKFDDKSLQREDIFEEVQNLENELAERNVFADLETGLLAALAPMEAREVYRWFCLTHLQDKLRLEEIVRLKQECKKIYKENRKLHDELSEGTGDFWLKAAIEHRDLFDQQLSQEAERIRQQYREQKKREAEEKSKRDTEVYEQQRKRSGSAPSFAKDIDWTQPHTEQEYVDAFGEKKIHAKRVREFLRPFAQAAKRRGRGRNKPKEYPFEAGLALFERAITKWITDSDKREGLLFMTSVRQVTLPTALTPQGLQFREMLGRLWKQFGPLKVETISPRFHELVENEEYWQLWHKELHNAGFPAVAEQFIS